jgi:hypothetical protein
MRQQATGQTETTELASDLDHGFSLPSSWYTDQAIVDLERERIFGHHWQYVGRSSQVAEVGDYFTGLTAREGDLEERLSAASAARGAPGDPRPEGARPRV